MNYSESRANTVESRSTTVESYATTIEPCAATIGFLKGRAQQTVCLGLKAVSFFNPFSDTRNPEMFAFRNAACKKYEY